MSVICWDGKSLSVDSRVTDDTGRMATRTKGFVLQDGSLFAGIGTILLVERMRGAVQGLRQSVDLTGMNQEDIDSTLCVWIKPEAFYLYYPFGDLYSIGKPEDVQEAFGTGAKYAVGAMLMGADSYRAVEIAIECCATCGPPIKTFVLGQGDPIEIA